MLCERLAYYGISTNLVSYLTKKLHQGNVSSARNVTTWQGTCYLSPLIGTALADAYWGRYWTIAMFSTIYVIIQQRESEERLFLQLVLLHSQYRCSHFKQLSHMGARQLGVGPGLWYSNIVHGSGYWKFFLGHTSL